MPVIMPSSRALAGRPVSVGTQFWPSTGASMAPDTLLHRLGAAGAPGMVPSSWSIPTATLMEINVLGLLTAGVRSMPSDPKFPVTLSMQ